MQRFTATIASIVMLLGVANYAAAKGGLPPVQPAGGCAKAINLTASPAGVLIAASGKARVRASLNAGFLNQDFVVEMAAVVPDGTTFMVWRSDMAGWPWPMRHRRASCRPVRIRSAPLAPSSSPTAVAIRS